MVKVNHLSLLLYNLHTSVVALKKNLEVKEIPFFYTSYCMFVVLNLTRIYNVSYNMWKFSVEQLFILHNYNKFTSASKEYSVCLFVILTS